MIRDYLDELVVRLEHELAGELVGVWQLGSAALGDFDPQRSDLDVQAVSATRTSRATRERIADRLSHPALECPIRGLEFVLYAQHDLHDPDGPAYSLNLNTGPRMAYRRSLDPAEDPRFWFVLDVAIGWEHGIALRGPDPSAVFPPLPPALVERSLAEALAWFAAEGSPEQTVLAACRAWAWRTEGRWLSKTQAARWAASRLSGATELLWED